MKKLALIPLLLPGAGLLALFQAPAPSQVQPLQVTAFLSTDCPVAMRQSPRLKALIQEFSGKAKFRAVFPQDLETSSKASAFLRERELDMAWSLDLGGVEAKKEGVERIPTFVVRDAKGKLLFKGGLDDSKVDVQARNHWLKDALAEASAGRPVRVAKVEAFGCLVMPGAAPPQPSEVTYASHVAAILNRSCVSCHRPGDTAPFSLVGYENARKWAPMIAEVTQSRKMPPWPAIEGVGDFHDANRLTPVEVATLQNWNKAKAPRGDRSKEPKPPVFPEGWRLGTPDIVAKMPEPFKVAATGEDEYWNFVIDPKLDREVYVRAVDVHPGSRTVVHHVIAFLDERNASAQLLAQPGSRGGGYRSMGGGVGFIPSGSLGGWAPGVQPNVLPEGAAWVLKPGTKIVLQVHFHKTGKEEVDQTEVGLYLTDKKPVSPVSIAWLARPGLVKLPPGQSRIPLSFNQPIPVDVDLFFLMPHMHLLGKEFKATLIKPDGEEEPLIQIDRWDFNWQMVYRLKTPKRLQAGSRIKVEAVYDNSENNPNNPHDPPKLVTWGEETTDEMMLLVAGISPVSGQARSPRSGS